MSPGVKILKSAKSNQERELLRSERSPKSKLKSPPQVMSEPEEGNFYRGIFWGQNQACILTELPAVINLANA